MRTFLENRLFGLATLIFISVFLFYYTIWVIVLPFVSEPYKSLVSRFFPPVSVALAIPVAIGSFVSLLLLGRAFHLVCQDRKKEAEAVDQDRRREFQEQGWKTKWKFGSPSLAIKPVTGRHSRHWPSNPSPGRQRSCMRHRSSEEQFNLIPPTVDDNLCKSGHVQLPPVNQVWTRSLLVGTHSSRAGILTSTVFYDR